MSCRCNTALCWLYRRISGCASAALVMLQGSIQKGKLIWDDIAIGGLAKAFFSQVVALSSTDACAVLKCSTEQGKLTWNDIPIGGLAQAFFSLVVAISSTDATKALSVCPVKRLIFHTRACFLASYLALPVQSMRLIMKWENKSKGA